MYLSRFLIFSSPFLFDHVYRGLPNLPGILLCLQAKVYHFVFYFQYICILLKVLSPFFKKAFLSSKTSIFFLVLLYKFPDFLSQKNRVCVFTYSALFDFLLFRMYYASKASASAFNSSRFFSFITDLIVTTGPTSSTFFIPSK